MKHLYTALFVALCIPTIDIASSSTDGISGMSLESISGGMDEPEPCPGRYCGRLLLEDATYSNCGPCPRGYQPSARKICHHCTSTPEFYDWLYLGFMALLSLILHWFFVDFTNKNKRGIVVLQLSALAESVIAAVLTVLLADPFGSLEVRSCPVKQMSDWYTMLYNPSPNYTTTLHCTQEIVYPLYTIVMTYYAFSLVFLMLLRPFISYKFVDKRGTKSIYAALYFLPILIVTQAVFGGLLYFLFPYIVIVSSVITLAIHLETTEEQRVKELQTIKDLIANNFTNMRNLSILLGHWILHAYGIIGLTRLAVPAFHGPLLALVPFPTVFYILTVKLTNPDNLT